MVRTLPKFSGLIASSWALSWCLYRLHGIRLIGPPQEEIWYFAYDANMHGSVFRQGRGMRPREWRPGRVRGYRLHFNLKAPRPAGRTIYAKCVPRCRRRGLGRPLQNHGRELVRLQATEGVPWWRYRPLWLDAEDIGGKTLKAATLMAKGDDNDHTPSLRYLALLQEGARAHGLPGHYIRFLEEMEHGDKLGHRNWGGDRADFSRHH